VPSWTPLVLELCTALGNDGGGPSPPPLPLGARQGEEAWGGVRVQGWWVLGLGYRPERQFSQGGYGGGGALKP